ncbi:NAD-dependent epimerase/dehydratase family protein [Bacillus spongiae]|uniref:NAD-dependent epimerase/dehydratase family protein n=1 Tax=Bacillus spongiae TaxID=2683610 RepID=A0ABU8HCY2_9BACI
MKILVLGGTRFFGKKLVTRLLDEGHEVTIATRGKTADPFNDKVNRIVMDREDHESLKLAVGSQHWDIVYDNICYSPQAAASACEVFAGKVKHYILTSTLSVYEFGQEKLTENSFDPYSYPIKLGKRTDFSYGEAKRLAEAVFFQQANFSVSAVRFPIVLGPDDYTKRLHFHIEQIKQEKPIGIPNKEAEMSYISSDEAAKFLHWLSHNHLSGPINACSKGELSLREILTFIEKEVEMKAIVREETIEENRSPFGIPNTWCMDSSKAQKAGYEFQRIESWFPALIHEIVEEA